MKEKAKRTDSLATILRHPGFATVITVFIIVTGLWGSIFAVEIRQAFPFYWGTGPISWVALFFWILVIISALMFFFRERSVTHELSGQPVKISHTINYDGVA
jgi:hypothetical protein